MKHIFCITLVVFVLSVTLSALGDCEKTVYITFDDGPTPNTPTILDILAKYDAKATFFVLDERISMYPEFLSRINAEGHAIGLHGVSHDVNIIYKSPSEPLNEMNKEQETLFNTIGIKTNLIRTPYGSHPYMSYDQYKILKAANYKIWDWTVDPRDSVGNAPSPQSLINRIAKDLKGNDFPIVLLHDKKSTAKSLDAILSFFKESGYSFGVLDEKMDSVNFMELYGPARNK